MTFSEILQHSRNYMLTIIIWEMTTRLYVLIVGNRPTSQGGLHYGPCSKDRYQPFHIVSNRTVDCWYLKNHCTEEGLVLCDNRNGDVDRTCRCDYTKGYAFVQSPKNNFSCIPSEEDCSCYKKVCSNETYKLNPGIEFKITLSVYILTALYLS